jgi:hypothetical protein
MSAPKTQLTRIAGQEELISGYSLCMIRFLLICIASEELQISTATSFGYPKFIINTAFHCCVIITAAVERFFEILRTLTVSIT